MNGHDAFGGPRSAVEGFLCADEQAPLALSLQKARSNRYAAQAWTLLTLPRGLLDDLAL